MRVYIIVVEGYTDCALIEAILQKYMNFQLYRNKKDMPDCLQRQVGTYPGALGQLQRNDTPHFLYREETAVMVKAVEGITNISNKLDEILEGVALSDNAKDIRGILMVCDADQEERSMRERQIAQKIGQKEKIDIDIEQKCLNYEDMSISYGIHIVPQQENGAVENLLLQMLESRYPELAQCAEEYRERIMGSTFETLRKKWASTEECQKMYADKVKFGAAAAVLKPDRPVGYAVTDCLVKKGALKDMLKIEEFRCLYEFFNEKIE